MLEVTGHIIARDKGGLWVSASAAGCHACGTRCGDRTTSLYLPAFGELSTTDEAPQTVVLGLGSSAGLGLLWHSLLLPLAGLLGGSGAGSVFAGGDGAVLLGAVAGFGIGLLLCKARMLDALNVRCN